MSHRDLSDWLIARRKTHPNTKACRTCKGTGRDPVQPDPRLTDACRDCRGFGY